MENIIEKEIADIVDNLLEDYETDRIIDKIDLLKQPDKQEIIRVLSGLLQIVYPGYYRDKKYKIYNIAHQLSAKVEDTAYHLNKQIEFALHASSRDSAEDSAQEDLTARSQRITMEFFRRIPAVRRVLQTDVEAGFQGDPAANSMEEIILSYPGLYGITVYRLAHELFLLGVPLIPRIMTEYAHSITGIDIHPGAAIGEHFFIDHGTGIVIGETAVIGDHVKIYQGVTIGALSTKDGQKLKGKKRHPTIENNVTIYAGASILGGDTVIGENSVIGGNVFIIASVPKDTKVNMKNPELTFKQNGQREMSVQELSQRKEWYYMI